MRRIRVSLAAFVLACLVAVVPTASAKPITFQIDPVHSRVGFSIRHIFTKVPGHFARHQGTFVFDAENPGASSVTTQIETASITTGNEKRDGHLASADFFDAAKFPTITFTSKNVKDLGEGKMRLEGDLSMHGVTKLVALDVTYLGSGPGPGGVLRAGFEATTRINRKDFGITWNRTLDQGAMVLGDDVDIRIDIEAVEEPPVEKKAEGKAEGKDAVKAEARTEGAAK